MMIKTGDGKIMTIMVADESPEKFQKEKEEAEKKLEKELKKENTGE